MLALRRGEQIYGGLYAVSRSFINAPVPHNYEPEDKYTEVPQYPKIEDLSFRSRKKRLDETWHKEIEGVPTIEEKLIKINMPRYYGYKVVQLSDFKFPYNCLPAIQHYTRTICEDLKNTVTGDKNQVDVFFEAVAGDVIDAIECSHDIFRNKHSSVNHQMDPIEKEQAFTQILLEQVNRVIMNGLSADCTHLKEVEVDYNPRHEAFWYVGGIDPPTNVVKSKKAVKWLKDYVDDPIDRAMQYNGTPYLSLRHPFQLPAWKSESECENIELAKTIPRYKYDARTLGYLTGHQHGTSIPGVWPSSRHSFGYLSYQSRAHMLTRSQSYGAVDFKEALQAQAVLSSFAWLLAQANYLGFNTFSDLTYPMNTQTVITNGRDWSFYEYQLNTTLVHSNQVDDNPRVNFCRGTDELQLYQEINDSGKCIGFNPEVLKQLLQFYLNVPNIQRNTEELTPFLDPKIWRIADYPEEERRTFLEKAFKHISSNRPKHLELPEIYLWEKIYKIDFKTRPMEPKRRYFELKINPWKRTLDQHALEYIPRALREGGPKSKRKWKKTYYP